MNVQIQGKPTVLKQLRAVADYQYGNGVGNTLFNGTIKIKGKYPRDRQIFRDNEHIANIRSKDGFLTILPQSAQEIVNLSYNNLEFGDERVTGSNIYAPGCLKADKRIHPNDDILVVFNNQVVATGTAVVSGEDMNKMTSGILARVKKKHKVKI
ncbi:MAG: PUA domain-containing protein [Candidatus Heimdallarchaeaceae archaeon]|jgi:predicted RNA-binding protein (TIGR00451 family)